MLILDGKATLDSNVTNNSKFIRQMQNDLEGKSEVGYPGTVKTAGKKMGVSAQHYVEHTEGKATISQISDHNQPQKPPLPGMNLKKSATMKPGSGLQKEL